VRQPIQGVDAGAPPTSEHRLGQEAPDPADRHPLRHGGREQVTRAERVPAEPLRHVDA